VDAYKTWQQTTQLPARHRLNVDRKKVGEFEDGIFAAFRHVLISYFTKPQSSPPKN
jgi:hypothetical protein